MTEENKHQEEELNEQVDTSLKEPTEEQLSEKNSSEEDNGQTEKSEKEKLAEAEEMIAKLKDQLLRQMAEFDNFRKRTIKEKTELILNGGQKVLESLLPVLDDFERAQDSMKQTDDTETIKEGINLIQSKLAKALSTHRLKKMEVKEALFDTDFHEAIALIPAQEEEQKGHIIDCVQSGYLLNEKVIRHAKVVVGQ